MLCLLSKALSRVNIERQIIARSICLIHCAENSCFSNSQKHKNYVQQIQPRRFLSSQTDPQEGLHKRFKKRLSKLFSDKTKVRIASLLAYEKLADGINLKEFFQHFELPDTFQSWFLVIQLHVWMCTLVTISERNGRLFRNGIVDSLWNDVEQRLEELKLEIPKSSDRKKYLVEMTDQFQAALVSYDEGILSDDTVLAAAAWRTLFSFQNVHPRLLEDAVHYIRKQVAHLDSLNSEDVILKGSISFLPLNSIVKPV